MTNIKPQQSSNEAVEPQWLKTREKGSILGMHFLIGLATFFGRAPARQVLRFVALYYIIFHNSVRRALRIYYTRLNGSNASFGVLWRHVYVFAQVALDRLFFAKGQYARFVVTRQGDHHLEQLAKEKRGAILLCAHVGSQAAMGSHGDDERFTINIVGYFKNARMINELLARINHRRQARVVNIEQNSVASVLDLKERIDRGELLAIAADRTGLNARFVIVDFLGAKARLAKGPFLLASMLKCPVFVTVALFRAPNRYELYCEPLCEPLDVPRNERERAISNAAQRYADCVGRYCRLAPDNWFNFYNFWTN